MEYGQVVLLMSDGSEGQALNIRKDVCFGRDHPAHIRIKSKSVAAQHARIHVDSSGTCFLQYLNSSSRPRINGVRMSSKRRDNLSLLPCSAQLHHLDVITIAGRSFLFKSKSGAVVDSYTHDGESTAMSMTLQGNQRQGDNRQRVDQEVDSMSIDSKGSRRSTNSQKSYNSAYSVNTVSTSGHSTENAFARIHLLKKDGSEGSSYAVIRELSFGSQRPANIRIKSTNLEIVHVKLVVDILRNKCSLVHVADKFPPKVNGRRIHSRSAVWLGNNDVISIVGRDFIFRTDVPDTLPWNDVENIDATTRCKHDAGTSLQKAKRTSRAFGRSLDENSGVFAAQSPTKLQINTVTLSGKVSSPLHSLSSVSSLSASESDAPKSPLTRPLLEVFPSSDGGDHHDISKSTTYKTFRTGEKYAPRDKSTTKHVQFERESTSFTYGSDSDHMDDEDDFFDIIAEADRLMLSHEEKFAVQVEYNRLALEEVCKVSDVKRRDEVNTAANVSKTVVESDDDEGRKDVDNISPSLPQFHDETSDEEGIAFNVTTTCFISNTDMSGVKSAECEKFPVEDDCTQEMDTSSTYAPRNSEVLHSASESLGSEECVNKIAGAHDNKLEATLFDYIVDSETRNACVAMEQQPESEGASTAASTVASTVASPGAASISQLPVVESENSVVASTVMLPHAVDTSNMNHVIRLLLSLALLEPLSKYHLEANEVYSVDDVDDIEDELKKEGDEFAVMLRPPPDAPSGKRQQGVWCLHTFRYLSRSWRGFF